ncbi:hypothetical protein Ga0074812_103232 [Parafrankia irregularis]|uniref:Uncharacterized protein n=1 Tax=Parafrankia irregularis TaxID=795642 RepID=A0A0S4QJR6_9ACTN|nr:MULTISPECIES: hypothetical protein [Parafrankia]MBE3200864.1 hypothetical protein [Parafrankia sp. CH37]CUU54742.1 hypothetical protein Ga0074812_103232 [Parafrankia irregularis]
MIIALILVFPFALMAMMLGMHAIEAALTRVAAPARLPAGERGPAAVVRPSAGRLSVVPTQPARARGDRPSTAFVPDAPTSVRLSLVTAAPDRPLTAGSPDASAPAEPSGTDWAETAGPAALTLAEPKPKPKPKPATVDAATPRTPTPRTPTAKLPLSKPAVPRQVVLSVVPSVLPTGG